MRAVVDNPGLVRLSGDRADRIRLSGWVIGTAVAAISGILIAPSLNLDVNLLTFLVIQALGACAVGYFTSLPWTFVGGLVVGVGASVATKFAQNPPWSGLPAAMPFLVLIVVLLVVPRRKLPRPRVSFAGIVSKSTSMSLRTKVATAAVVSAGLVIIPGIVSFRLPVWIAGLSYLVIFASLGLLVWGSGQISLCHAVFLALGATSMAHLTHDGVPWFFALLLAGLFTVPIGIVVAIPAIRLSGIYLALVTLGFGILMSDVIYGTPLMFGSALDATVARPKLGFINGASDKWMYYITLVIAVACLGVIALVARSRFGRLLRAMAQTPTMLTTHGLSVNMSRLIVFCLSAFFAGIGGALAVTGTGAVSGVTFTPTVSLLLIAVLAICGTRLLMSAAFAALLFGVLPGYVSIGQDRETLIFGGLALAAALVLANRDRLGVWMAGTANRSARRRQHGPARAPRLVREPKFRGRPSIPGGSMSSAARGSNLAPQPVLGPEPRPRAGHSVSPAANSAGVRVPQ
jgi:ABC-type branched-subunit amino acid transport system permease subunit